MWKSCIISVGSHSLSWAVVLYCFLRDWCSSILYEVCMCVNAKMLDAYFVYIWHKSVRTSDNLQTAAVDFWNAGDCARYFVLSSRQLLVSGSPNGFIISLHSYSNIPLPSRCHVTHKRSAVLACGWRRRLKWSYLVGMPARVGSSLLTLPS